MTVSPTASMTSAGPAPYTHSAETAAESSVHIASARWQSTPTLVYCPAPKACAPSVSRPVRKWPVEGC